MNQMIWESQSTASACPAPTLIIEHKNAHGRAAMAVAEDLERRIEKTTQLTANAACNSLVDLNVTMTKR